LNSSFTHFITTYSFHTRANEISFEDFQDELLSHELMLNQQQQQATDYSSFALTAQGPPQFQTFKGKTPLPNRFPQRIFSPRPNNGYPSPKPYSHQFSRGPPQYNRNYDRGYNRNSPQGYYPRNSMQNNQQGNNTFPRQNNNQASMQHENLLSHGSRAPCQICGRINHLAIDCFHPMDYAFQGRNPPTQLAAMVAHTNSVYEEQ
jgi:hypothetical protein